MSDVAQQARPFRVAVVPDSFKGTAPAASVAEAMARGVREAFAGSAAGVEVRTLPFADGGEGTLDAFLGAWGVPARECPTTDALGRPVTARYGISPDGRTAVVETAEANGLPAVSDVPLRPLDATTAGVGALVTAVLDAGVEEIVLCLGGSATTDGGAGLLRSLGARFLDAAGAGLPDGGGALAALDEIDLSGLDPRARKVRWRVACDVTNPLLGPAGAAATFGPQKGATPADVVALDAGLARLADVLAAATGVDARNLPGTGAAGGMPLVLTAALGAELVAGSQLVAETLGLADVLAGADLVLTGEGRLDTQSLHGKVVDAVRRSTPAGVPVVVIAGDVAAPLGDLRAAGITAAFSIAPGPRTLAELGRDVLAELERTAANVTRLVLAGR